MFRKTNEKDMPPEQLDANLETWDAIKDSHHWSGLLIGNGASQAIWPQFAYKSLYEEAKEQVLHRLTAEDQNLFDAFDTTNFELVLSNLATAKVVNAQLGVSGPIVGQRYASIQNALAQAVRDAHLPWPKFPDTTKDTIKKALLDYSFVYSTNYDLLLYWAINHQGAAGFKDYFWVPTFNLANTEVWDKATNVLYLHGGIHLYRTADGKVLKYQAPEGRNLLASFGTHADRVPLFVAEGTSASKLSTILRSDYLGFAYSKLMTHDGPMVIFGSSLDTTDAHIATAINKANCPVLAISIYPGDTTATRKAKAHFFKELPHKKLYFFDSTTHPLGEPSMLVSP